MNERPHPLGLTWHPAWDGVEARRHALRVAERKRRDPKPSRWSVIRAWFVQFVT